MKTKFDVDVLNESKSYAPADIIGKAPKNKPYLNIEYVDGYDGKRHLLAFPDKELKIFATNILKALGYKITVKKSI